LPQKCGGDPGEMARLRTISRNLQCDLRGSCAVKLQEVLIGFVNKDSPGFVGWKVGA
jgi:hypothetical protein